MNSMRKRRGKNKSPRFKISIFRKNKEIFLFFFFFFFELIRIKMKFYEKKVRRGKNKSPPAFQNFHF